MKTDKSILIEQLEWALVKAKYNPKANFNEIAEHLDYAQSLVKNLTIPRVSNNEVVVCDLFIPKDYITIDNLCKRCGKSFNDHKQTDC